MRLSKAQCKAIMAPLLQYSLPALGICHNFPRQLVFAPYEYMGLNFLHLHTLQEIARLKDLIFHTFNDTLMGLLYRSSTELLLLELGCSSDYLTPSLIALLSTTAFVKDTWQFLPSHHIVLHHDICFPLSRQHDQLIMEAFISLNLPLDDLKACNHCRIYLRALYLSNIITGDGMYVDESAWNGTPYIPPHKLKSWPHYGKPDRSSWEKWRKWVKIAFLGRGRRLRNPLGNWLQRDDNWPWYTSDDGCLYQFNSTQWLLHAPVLRHSQLPSFE